MGPWRRNACRHRHRHQRVRRAQLPGSGNWRARFFDGDARRFSAFHGPHPWHQYACHRPGVGAALTILLIIANSSRATAGLFTFVILLSTAGVLVLYGVGALAAWKQSRAPGQRVATIVGLIFVAFAFYGVGAGSAGWSLVLLAIGYVLRVVMQRASLRAANLTLAESPAAPRE